MHEAPPQSVRTALLNVDRGEVLLWLGSVSDRAQLTAASTLLTPQERNHASGIRAGFARDEFVLGRGMLRHLLTLALGRPNVEFTRNTHGKPSTAGIEFNVSHSGGHVLIALCRDAPVGVDIEALNPDLEANDLAASTFHPMEVEEIAASRDPSRTFCELWVRKEAILKCHGAGLTGIDDALASFEVSVNHRPDAPVRLEEHLYFVLPCEAPKGYLAAVASPLPNVTHRFAFLDNMDVRIPSTT